MKIMICGGSGFIGQNLTRYLLDQGDRVVILDRNSPERSSPQLEFFRIDLLRPDLFEEAWFGGVEAVVNLSGESIFTLWTEKTKRMIWDTRVAVNKNLIDFIAGLDKKPGVFVSASAVGYYGDRGERELSEQESPGRDFLAEVCIAWEAEARKAEKSGMRSVQVRTAPVLLKNGGILQQLLKSMMFGVTFVFGEGNQWFPWIHMKDLIRIYHLAIADESLSGPVNACAPGRVRYREFIDGIRKYKKAIVLSFPPSLLKLFLQETSNVLLFSQRPVPVRLLEKNFQFSYPKLEDAFRDIFGEER